MKGLYRDNRKFAQKGGWLSKLALTVGLVAVFLLVFASILGYAYRRQLADAWRQSKVAAIPPPPGIQVPTAPAKASDGNLADAKASGDDLSASPSDLGETSGDEGSAGGDDGEPLDESADSTVPMDDTDGTEAAGSGTSADTPADTAAASGQPPSGAAELPKEANLNVPMVYQAPFNIWDEKHDDACEEASALIVASYWEGKLSLSRQEMEDRLMDLIDYQLDTLGSYKDTDAEQTAALMRDKLGLKNVAVLPVNSLDDIRRQIAAGRPVILPADGKALQNPNFRNGGPDYHMFVVKGYTETHFIVNDPGTRRGANWLYTNEIISQSVHDFNGGDVANGQPVMVVAW